MTRFGELCRTDYAAAMAIARAFDAGKPIAHLDEGTPFRPIAPVWEFGVMTTIYPQDIYALRIPT